jgi:hypothetical protein
MSGRGAPKTGTVHHCPGRDGWVDDISPGNCVKINRDGAKFCNKHQMLCRNGCRKFHMKSQVGCTSCQGRIAAEKRHADAAAIKAKEHAKKKADNDWYHETKGRKK